MTKHEEKPIEEKADTKELPPVSDTSESDTAVKNPLSGLTPGRMVHYVWPNKQHVPAIVTASDELGYCELFIMPGSAGAGYQAVNANCALLDSVPFDESSKPIGTWHWMERVE